MQDLASEERAKTLELELELDRLRPLEREVRKLRRLEARLPAIEHYLKLIPKLTEYVCSSQAFSYQTNSFIDNTI